MQNVPKGRFFGYFDHFRPPPLTHSKSLYTTNKVHDKGSYSPKSVQKYVVPETAFVSYFFELEITENCQNCHISCNFDQFWDHMTHSKALYTTNEVR